jgi:hypothetical protein
VLMTYLIQGHIYILWSKQENIDSSNTEDVV